MIHNGEIVMSRTLSSLVEGGKMQAVLRNLYCTEIEELESYLPDDPENFGFLLRAMVGPLDGGGEESFDVYVCTPK